MFLDYIKEGFEIGEYRLSAFKFAKHINALKVKDERYEFIAETPEKMTTETIRDCYRVYQNYRKAIKEGNHNIGKPKYKSKKYKPIRSLYLRNDRYVTLYYSNGISYSHESILKDKRYKRIEEKIKKLQKIISHKQEINYQKKLKEYVSEHGEEPKEKYKNIMKGKSFNTLNIKRLWDKIRKLFIKRTNIVRDYINKLVNDILVRTKPYAITIETLNIKDMLENDSSHKLHDHIAKSNWYRFFSQLKNKCEEYMIELRRANRYFASSKICSNCNKKNKDLTLNDRVYICDECGLKIDRDLNAAINLCKLDKYTIVV